MMTRKSLGLACVMVLAQLSKETACRLDAEKPTPLSHRHLGEKVDVLLKLVDGSFIKGKMRSEAAVSVQSQQYQLGEIRLIKMKKGKNLGIVHLHSGRGRVQGSINLPTIQMSTLFGRISVGIQYMTKLRVLETDGVAGGEDNGGVTGGGDSSNGKLPVGEGPITFGGYKWTPWRTKFEVQGDKLVSTPNPRPAFNYGHSGHGRGPLVVTNIDSAAWKNYTIEFEYGIPGVDSSWNPYGLPVDLKCYTYIYFHLVDAKESWNDPGLSTYTLTIDSENNWGFRGFYNFYATPRVGYGTLHKGAERRFGGGEPLVNMDRVGGNKYRIDVVGNRIKFWVDGELQYNFVDVKMSNAFDGFALDHGGVGFHTPWECMFWVRNFTARAL